MKADPAPPPSGFHLPAFGIVTALVFPIVLGVAIAQSRAYWKQLAHFETRARAMNPGP